MKKREILHMPMFRYINGEMQPILNVCHSKYCRSHQTGGGCNQRTYLPALFTQVLSVDGQRQNTCSPFLWFSFYKLDLEWTFLPCCQVENCILCETQKEPPSRTWELRTHLGLPWAMTVSYWLILPIQKHHCFWYKQRRAILYFVM